MFSKRLSYYIEYQHLSVSAFERECSITQGVVYKSIQNQTILSGTNLTKIAKRYPDLSMDWLITGSGRMANKENYNVEDKLDFAKANITYWRNLVGTLKLTINEKYTPLSSKNETPSKEDSSNSPVTVKGIRKIIKSNPALFKTNVELISEKEAIRYLAAYKCEGNKIQIKDFEIRQSFIAICNLLSLGFRKTAIDLAEQLIPTAEYYQQYHVAQELCNKLITHHYQWGHMDSVKKYKELYDRFTEILKYEHESKLLYGDAIYRYKHIQLIDVNRTMETLEDIKTKVPENNLSFHYHYFQCKTLLYKDEELEKIYLEGLHYFEEQYLKHTNYISIFANKLIRFYLDYDKLEKALMLVEEQNEKFEPGTIRWFRNALSYVNVLLKMNNPKAIDVCDVVTAHAKFKELPDDRKKEWEVAFKASIKIRTGSSKK